MDTDSLPEVRKHRAYVDNFSALLHAERNSEMGEGDLVGRVAQGRTIRKAKLHREGSNIRGDGGDDWSNAATGQEWSGDAWGQRQSHPLRRVWARPRHSSDTTEGGADGTLGHGGGSPLQTIDGVRAKHPFADPRGTRWSRALA